MQTREFGYIITKSFLRSVQMRLYSMHKREFVMVFVAFFACFGLAVFIGLAGTFDIFIKGVSTSTSPLNLQFFLGPPITSTTEQKAHLNGSDMATGPYIMRTPALSTYSQQLWVIAKLSTSNTDSKYHKVT